MAASGSPILRVHPGLTGAFAELPKRVRLVILNDGHGNASTKNQSGHQSAGREESALGPLLVSLAGPVEGRRHDRAEPCPRRVDT
jgi:hypothetical protein